MHAYKDIYHIFDRLKSTSLAPSSETNTLFSDLVALASNPKNDGIEHDGRVRELLPELHSLCSVGESLLEEFWARRITSSGDPLSQLALMPYENNYRQLSRLEVMSLRIPRRITRTNALFVGSGPLPLSAICMARDFHFSVTCIDSSKEAVSLSSKVISTLNLDSRIYIEKYSAEHYQHYSTFDVVILAALVGSTDDEKQNIIDHIAKSMKPGAYLLVRSADGARELLYPKVEVNTPPQLKEIIKILPRNEVINSVYVYQRFSPRPQSTEYAPIERMIYA